MKRTLLILAAALFFSAIYAQEADIQEESPFSPSPAPLPFDFVLQFEPALYLKCTITYCLSYFFWYYLAQLFKNRSTAYFKFFYDAASSL